MRDAMIKMTAVSAILLLDRNDAKEASGFGDVIKAVSMKLRDLPKSIRDAVAALATGAA